MGGIKNMGLTILPIRTKSIGRTCNSTQCSILDKKNTDTQKKSILAYPEEYFLMPPLAGMPMEQEKLIQPISKQR